MSVHNFQIPFKDFNILICAIKSGLIQLVTSNLKYDKNIVVESTFMLDGLELTKMKCNNKHICQTFI